MDSGTLVFLGGQVGSDDDEQTNAILQTAVQSLPEPSTSRSDEEQRVSTYVRTFEDMVSTVIKEEKHLFDDEEFMLITHYAHLSYKARFLMVKLLLRKQETWHRLNALNYENELGSVGAIVEAIDELCQVIPGVVKQEQSEGTEVLDDATEESVADLQPKPVLVDTEASKSPPKDRPFVLARNEREMDLKSLLECLRVDELKTVAKQLRLKKVNQKKDDLIRDLLGASSSQSTLTAFAQKDSVAQPSGGGLQQTKLPFGNLKSQKDRLKEIVLDLIGKCVRVDEEFFGLIHRVNLVYFRITLYTPDILVAALLTRFAKRSYAGYECARTRNVWASRQDLLDYEEVLILEAQVDMLLAGNIPALGGRTSGGITPAARCLPTPVTPGNVEDTREETAFGDEDMLPDVKPDSNRVRGARMVKDIFERVFPRWQELVKIKGEEDGRANGLERFHHGHVLTRIVCKASSALGTLEEYERELAVLEALLAQKRWRRGKRGKWHDRRALILSNHLLQDEGTMDRALDAVIEALRDPDTHIVFRPKLVRRLKTLENKLRIPAEERHICDGILEVANKVFFEAVRLRHRAASLKLDQMGRCISADTPQPENRDIKHYYSPVTTSVKLEPGSSMATPRRRPQSDIQKGKSIWLGRDGEELSVEALALQRYEDQGFKGVHCETRVISMLFGLLFWDIIFESIPGAFETPYQTAPLDIAEDSFYHARKDLMEERLTAITDGKGVDIVRDVDAKHRISKTWCVGVQWDLFSSEDVVNIVTCIGGQALAAICRVLCEDYTFGTSGGPDLFLWNAEKGTCKFVEVKGPGDTLQANQRVWIDILLKAPVAVEECRVVESGSEIDKKPNTRTPKSSRRKGKRARKVELVEMGVDTADADALPTILDDSHDTEEQLDHSDGHFMPDPANLQLEGTSGPLKRKASPRGVSPTPSKRPKTS